jgi:ParB family transcriptional regulator, chromosome partitioning protein
VSKERRLGRGLEALLGRNYGSLETDEGAAPPATEFTAADSHATTGDQHAPVESGDVTRSADGQQWMSLAAIDRNPYQPRQAFDEAEIADLCDSIRAHGFLQPIVVRPCEGRYQLIAGERRLRAAQMAGWERVPVQIREVADQQMAELAIVENVQRKDLNAIEKAVSFKRYLDQYGCTQEELASRVNIDRSTVANLVRLLDLPEEVKQAIVRGDLTAGHARALLPLGDEHEQIEFAKRIQKEGISVRGTEQAVSDHIRRADDEPLSIVDAEGNSRPSPMQPGQHIRDLQSQLGLALGTRVDVKQSAKGRGRITIHFASHEEFDRLRGVLMQQPEPQTGTM